MPRIVIGEIGNSFSSRAGIDSVSSVRCNPVTEVTPKRDIYQTLGIPYGDDLPDITILCNLQRSIDLESDESTARSLIELSSYDIDVLLVDMTLCRSALLSKHVKSVIGYCFDNKCGYVCIRAWESPLLEYVPSLNIKYQQEIRIPVSLVMDNLQKLLFYKVVAVISDIADSKATTVADDRYIEIIRGLANSMNEMLALVRDLIRK